MAFLALGEGLMGLEGLIEGAAVSETAMVGSSAEAGGILSTIEQGGQWALDQAKNIVKEELGNLAPYAAGGLLEDLRQAGVKKIDETRYKRRRNFGIQHEFHSHPIMYSDPAIQHSTMDLAEQRLAARQRAMDFANDLADGGGPRKRVKLTNTAISDQPMSQLANVAANSTSNKPVHHQIVDMVMPTSATNKRLSKTKKRAIKRQLRKKIKCLTNKCKKQTVGTTNLVKAQEMSNRGFKGNYSSQYSAKRGIHELKFLDTNIPVTQVATGEAASDTPLINGIVQGTDIQQRIGRTVIIKKIHVRLTVEPEDGTLLPTTFKVLLVQDKQANSTVPLKANILNGTSPHVFNNLDNRKRFRVIKTKTMLFGTDKTSATALSTGIKRVDWSVKTNIETVFDGAGGTFGDINTNSLFLVFLSDTDSGGAASDGVTVKGEVRIRFVDH